MRRSIAELLAFLNRWPRRLAALSCLLLAGASALASRGDASADAARNTSAVVISGRALPVGATLTPRDLRVARWPRALVPHGRVSDPGSIVGRRLAGPIGPGEAVTTTRLVGAGLAAGLPSGLVASAASVATYVASFVHAGERVDVLAGPPEGIVAGADAPTRSPPAAAVVVAKNVLVLAVLPSATPAGDTATAQLVVATDRGTALRIAAIEDRVVLAVVSNPP